MKPSANQPARPVVLFILTWALLHSACARDERSQVSDTVVQTPRTKQVESVLDVSDDALEKAQAKITYIGEQSKPIFSVVFFTEGMRPSLERFFEVQPDGHPYINDNRGWAGADSFAVTSREFCRMMAAVKPTVVQANVSKPQYPIRTRQDFAASRAVLSFNVVRETANGFEGYDFRLGHELPPQVLVKSFYEKLISSLEPGNQAGRQALTSQFQSVVPSSSRKASQ